MKKIMLAAVAASFVSTGASAIQLPAEGEACSTIHSNISVGINNPELSDYRKCVMIQHDIDTAFTYKTFWVRNGTEFTSFPVETLAKMSRGERIEFIKNGVTKEMVAKLLKEQREELEMAHAAAIVKLSKAHADEIQMAAREIARLADQIEDLNDAIVQINSLNNNLTIALGNALEQRNTANALVTRLTNDLNEAHRQNGSWQIAYNALQAQLDSALTQADVDAAVNAALTDIVSVATNFGDRPLTAQNVKDYLSNRDVIIENTEFALEAVTFRGITLFNSLDDAITAVAYDTLQGDIQSALARAYEAGAATGLSPESVQSQLDDLQRQIDSANFDRTEVIGAVITLGTLFLSIDQINEIGDMAGDVEQVTAILNAIKDTIGTPSTLGTPVPYEIYDGRSASAEREILIDGITVVTQPLVGGWAANADDGVYRRYNRTYIVVDGEVVGGISANSSRWQGIDGVIEAHIDGWTEGFEAGYTRGFNDGYDEGYADGYADGFRDGVNSTQ